jgi:hypothetical protein
VCISDPIPRKILRQNRTFHPEGFDANRLFGYRNNTRLNNAPIIDLTVDKLSETNPEFNKFIKSAVSDIAGKKIHLEEYDKILTDNDILEYIQKHNI